jgi:signal transduction histidine kinase
VKPRVKLIVGLVIAAASVLVLIYVVSQGRWDPEHVLLWTAVCLVSELFWVKTRSGDSVQSLAATAKLSAILILDVWAALLAIFVSTVVGNFIFRRSKWYRAVYNGSQLMLAGAAAALVYQVLGGSPFLNTFDLPGGQRMEAVAGNLADRRFLSAFLLASITYIVVNNTLMAWLMNAMTGRRMTTLWKENCLYAEEVQSSLALVLLSPLLVLLYGTLGVAGLLILFACLALVHAANRRYLAVIRAQEDLLRSERMAAMGELAQEIGRSLGQYLNELKVSANRVFQRARHADGEKVSHSAEVIHINVGNMSALVDGLAAFSHQETHKVPTDLNELVRRTVEFVRPQNRFDAIHFKITPDPILPMVNVDPAQLQQVFINLLTNAADALAEVDRPVKKIFVETHYDPGTQRVRVAFSDNGPGVPDANLNRIFEPHFTTKVTGHGFGLSTAFRIAANHRGLIRASNLPGGGANFLLDLPNA